MQEKKAKIFMWVVALTAWFALALQQYIIIDNRTVNGMTMLEAIGRFLIFFTILCNILVAVSLTSMLISPRSATGRFFSKPAVITAIAVYIFVVGLVYNTILRGLLKLEDMKKLADELLHVIIPLLFTIYWIFFASKKSLQWANVLPWLIFPAVYLIYAMVRGHFERFYPYPFIDANMLPIGRLLINCTGMLLLFVLVGLLFVAVGKKLSR